MMLAILVQVDTPALKEVLLLLYVRQALMLRKVQPNVQNAMLVGTAQVALMSQRDVRMGGLL